MSEVMGCLKGKSSLMNFDRYANLKYKHGNRHSWCRGYYVDTVASIDKGTRGSAGRKFPHAASKPLRIHKVFSAVFSLSASISAPAELLRIGQPWIFEGFLFFWTQAG